MNRMINKTKKIVLTIIAMVFGVLSFTTVSSAYYVGQRLSVSYWQYMSNSNIYCVEHGQALRNTVSYKIISEIDINGKTSTDYTGKQITHNDNAKLAYILSGDNGSNKSTGPVANGIWNFMYTWMQSVGQHHAGLYKGFVSNTKGNSSYLNSAANNYANNLGDAKITDNTNKNNIQVKAYQRNGHDYLRIGPFNWTFSGTITGLTALDQNNNGIKGMIYSSFNGNSEYWYNVNQIKSGRDFYISIPADGNVTRITQISATASIDVKGVKIWFLEANNGYMQNLIIREPHTGKDEITTPFDYDIPIQGNLRVIKVNEDNHEIRLQGVGFYIQHKQTGKYVHQDSNGNISYVDSREQATEFVTDSNGEILIRNLIVGTYVAYETKNPNYGYEIIKDGQEQQIAVDKTTDFVIGNKQIYVKLSGFVWVDKQAEKQWIRNDLYHDDEFDINDILLNGITVRLKDRTTGETVKEMVTGENSDLGDGQYLFTDVLIEKLSDYYIEFEYDGLTYTNVVPHLYDENGNDLPNGSKSAESAEDRDAFNRGFSVVEGRTQTTGYTLDENGNEKHQLTYNYDSTEHKSTLINNGQYPITANTDVTEYIIREHYIVGQEEIKYINLGLYEREQPDLAIAKDIENVRVTVNGYEHTYEYAQRFNHPENYGGEGFNVGVKFGEKYAAEPYTRAIYEADYEYVNENDPSKELKVYITYKIAMKNESTNLIAQINSIVDYYDSRYSIIGVGTGVDERGNITGGLEYTDGTYNDNYKKVVINNNTRIDPLTSTLDSNEGNVYVQFELNREAVINVLNGQETLDNVVEINSYSIFDSNGNIYAGIDKDSNPGTTNPEDKATYEDDTDAALSLRLEVADAREMTGKVFEDEPVAESGEDVSGVMTGKVRQGSGIYEDGETGIAGVEVTLTENTGSGKVYNATTDANGDFYISGYIPGDYTLTYTWGDQTYTVQNYKGTVYNADRDQNNKEWYKQDVDIRYTDALDDYELRQAIDAELTHIENSTQTTIDKMNSMTPTMGIGVEYDTTTTASTGDRYTYQIRNIDFGIIERAKQDISINKRVKTLKVTLANGQVVNNITIEDDGSITGDKSNITYMPPSDMTQPSNGFIRVELDNEVMQGATLEVGYEFVVTNNSELDYLSENFYKYGIIEGNVVTINATGIIDYLDKDWAFDNETNTQWQIKTLDEVKDLLQEEVYQTETSTIDDKTILYTDSLKDAQIEPTQSESVMLNVSKILTTSEDISLDNETEIVEVDKTGGSDLVSTPGNYVPGTGHTESDDDMAETVIVTPATGDNLSYILPISIGIIALLVIGVGVIVIKKKALGNN